LTRPNSGQFGPNLRRGDTNTRADIKNTDLVVIMGGSAEALPAASIATEARAQQGC
jgi:NAD-dependent SIR2 family protein deacetylase